MKQTNNISIINHLKQMFFYLSIDQTEKEHVREAYELSIKAHSKSVEKYKPKEGLQENLSMSGYGGVTPNHEIFDNFTKSCSHSCVSNLANTSELDTSDLDEEGKNDLRNFYSQIPYIAVACYSRTIRDALLASPDSQDNALGKFANSIKNSTNSDMIQIRNAIKNVTISRDMVEYALTFTVSYEMVSRIVGNMFLPTQVFKSVDFDINPSYFVTKGFESIPINFVDVISHVEVKRGDLSKVTWNELEANFVVPNKKYDLVRLPGYQLFIASNLDIYNTVIENVKTMLEKTPQADIEDAITDSHKYKIALQVGIRLEKIITGAIIDGLTDTTANNLGGGLYLSNIPVLQEHIKTYSEQEPSILLPEFEVGQPNQYAKKTKNYQFGRMVSDDDLLKQYSSTPLTIGNGDASIHNGSINFMASLANLGRMLELYRLGTGKDADLMFMPLEVMNYIYMTSPYYHNIEVSDLKIQSVLPSIDSPFHKAISFESYNEVYRKQLRISQEYGGSQASGGYVINRCPIGSIKIDNRNISVIPIQPKLESDQHLLRYVTQMNDVTDASGTSRVTTTTNGVTRTQTILDDPFPRFLGTFHITEVLVASSDLYQNLVFNANPLSSASPTAKVFAPSGLANAKTIFAHGVGIEYGYQTDLAVGKFTSVVADKFMGFQSTSYSRK